MRLLTHTMQNSRSDLKVQELYIWNSITFAVSLFRSHINPMLSLLLKISFEIANRYFIFVLISSISPIIFYVGFSFTEQKEITISVRHTVNVANRRRGWTCGMLCLVKNHCINYNGWTSPLSWWCLQLYNTFILHHTAFLRCSKARQ